MTRGDFGTWRSRPLLYSAEMVRARRAGMKTMTRRLVKPQPPGQPVFYPEEQDWFVEGTTWRMRCPYGQVGDSVWVKENWRAPGHFDKTKPIDIPEGTSIGYEADGIARGGNEYEWGRLRPSIHMRRWMSRQEDVITSIRAEPLHDINEADAWAEGVEPCGGFMSTSGCWTNYSSDGSSLSSARESYVSLWDSINGERSPWIRNDWVWVLGFPAIVA